MKCIRCHVNIPDKALFCPWCGKQQDETSAPVHRKKRRRPKGSGSVYKLKGARARPYVAVTGKKEVLGTYGTSGEAVQALDAYQRPEHPRSVSEMHLCGCLREMAGAAEVFKSQPGHDKWIRAGFQKSRSAVQPTNARPESGGLSADHRPDGCRRSLPQLV